MVTRSAGEKPGAAAIDALQQALAAEHAAVFVYGVLGAQTSRSTEPVLSARLLDAYRVHQARRDQWDALIRAAGSEPDAPEPAYDPGDVSSSTAITARAKRLELACAKTYAYLVANTVNDIRRTALEALSEASVRSLDFGAKPSTLPGL